MPTNPIRGVRVFVEALGKLGYDTQKILRAAGVTPEELANPDARVPCSVTGEVLAAAMRARPLKNLGMKLAAETPIGAFPLLDYLIVSCQTVNEGVHQLAQYLKLEGVPYHLEIRDDEDPVRIAFCDSSDVFSLEFGVSLAVLHLREETNSALRAQYVSFSHQPEDVSEFERVLDCRVHCKAAWTGIAFSRDGWQLPFRRRDAVLRGVLERHAQELLARLPASTGLTGELRRILTSRIAGGDVEVRAVARALGTSARSLQRRLADAGTSYQEVLDSVRRETAHRYLTEKALSIGEVAYLLGYSEPAAFHRAFKRWSGQTPQEFRENAHRASV